MFGKNLQPGWEQNASIFLEKLRNFLKPSCSIGLVNFHSIIHCVNICKKYRTGMGSLGLDQCIESLHSFITFEILPNICKTKLPSPSETFTDTHSPSNEYIEKFRDIFGRQLECCLNPTKFDEVKLKNTEYLKNVTIDFGLISKFDSEAQNHPLLCKLTSAAAKTISKNAQDSKL